MLSCSVFYIKQKVELKKFNCFFAGFLKQSFLRMKVIQTVVESEYTPDRRRQICFPYQVYTRQKATDLISIPSIHQTEGDRFAFHTRQKATDFLSIPKTAFKYCFKHSLNSSLVNTEVLQSIYFAHYHFTTP